MSKFWCVDCLKSNTRKLSWDEYFNWKEVKAVDSLKLVPNSCYNRKQKACANREEATSLKRQKPMTDILKPKARANEQGGPRVALEDIPEEKTDVDPDLQQQNEVIQTTTTKQDKKCDDILSCSCHRLKTRYFFGKKVQAASPKIYINQFK